MLDIRNTNELIKGAISLYKQMHNDNISMLVFAMISERLPLNDYRRHITLGAALSQRVKVVVNRAGKRYRYLPISGPPSTK